MATAPPHDPHRDATSPGEAALREYRCNARTEQHFFCAACGVRTFGKGASKRWGPYVAVSVNCLDDVPPDELAAAPISYLDGRNDNWSTPPLDTRNL